MSPSLEVWRPTGHEAIPLAADRVTIGKHSTNEIAVPTDPTVSRLHAVVERYSSGWVVRDVGSRNGTFVNGERIIGEKVLRPGDEIRVGETKIVFRPDHPVAGDLTMTETAAPPPALTPRERDVLLELCRPVLGGDLFTEPASIREIADVLVISDAAVKQHLSNLYEKFGVNETSRRRVKLANEAVRRGAVTLADLRGPSGRPS